MGEQTGIAWTDHTWNPWHGCTKVSPGCKFCYMYREKARYGQDPSLVVRSRTTFRAPLKWTAPGRVFTCSWSDFFIAEADAWRDDAWKIIAQTPHLTYQILTKRPERIAGRLPWTDTPWPNVWLGVSVENQDAADERIAQLLATPAAVRFLSIEPLIGPVNLERVPFRPGHGHNGNALYIGDEGGVDFSWTVRNLLHWVIIGGESGSQARPSDVDWVRAIVEQCRLADVPCFVKQLGAHFLEVPPGRRAPGELQGTKWRRNFRDRKGGDPDEWPADLRVREFPTVRVPGSHALQRS